MLVAGIDIGSVAAKAVIYDVAKKKSVGFALQPSGWNTKEAGEQVLSAACTKVGIAPDQLQYIVGTGYGRIALPMAHKVVTEITCHAKGASYLFPKTGVVLDIGGQDSKVISIDDSGLVQDFLMNDKCAAGTGRFLQVLSGILGMDLVQLGEAAKHGKPVSISSMCAVFAETEIIGLLAQGTPPEDIATGVFLSIARRMRSLAGRIPMRGECTFTGGLATSPAFAHLLAEELNVAVNVPDEPQLVGALGASLIAAKMVQK
ncbi:MAG: acyl-CoA dehydratase activase [Pseudomonadota bacterium]